MGVRLKTVETEMFQPIVSADHMYRSATVLMNGVWRVTWAWSQAETDQILGQRPFFNDKLDRAPATSTQCSGMIGAGIISISRPRR
jgi:hypothetical protein